MILSPSLSLHFSLIDPGRILQYPPSVLLGPSYIYRLFPKSIHKPKLSPDDLQMQIWCYLCPV